jgi:ABC-type multidrug transport system permease subunit
MIAYYIARVITAIMFQCAYVFVFVTISYWMIGFERDIVRILYIPLPFIRTHSPRLQSSFLAYMFALVLLGSIAVTLGIVIGGIVPSVQMGPAIVSPLLIPLSVFSGFLVSPNLIPPWFIWIYYISFFQYTFHFMVTTQFYNVFFPCCGANCNGLVCNGTTVTVPQDPVEYCPYGYGCITGKGTYYITSLSHTHMHTLCAFFVFLLATFLSVFSAHMQFVDRFLGELPIPRLSHHHPHLCGHLGGYIVRSHRRGILRNAVERKPKDRLRVCGDTGREHTAINTLIPSLLLSLSLSLSLLFFSFSILFLGIPFCFAVMV